MVIRPKFTWVLKTGTFIRVLVQRKLPCENPYIEVYEVNITLYLKLEGVPAM